MFDLAARWIISVPVERLAVVSAYDAVLMQLVDLFVQVGGGVGVDQEELRGGIEARHLYWRAQALKNQRAWADAQNAERKARRSTPGEVIAAFLSRHKMTEKELLGRIDGKFSKNTLAKIKAGNDVRPDRYTALAVAMAELEPDFERDALLPY